MQNIENIQNEEMIIHKGAYAPDYDNESDSFASFLTKSVSSQFNGCMTIHNLTQIFPKIDKSNILRSYCLHVLTDSSLVEIPSTKDIMLSTDSNSISPTISKPISITLSDEYAKWLIPRSLFYKIIGYTDYLKSVFSDGISSLEKKIFAKGIIDGVEKVTKKVNLGLNSDELLKLMFSLNERYRKEAVFIMSSESLRMISSQKDTQGRFIFDGVDKLFGHKVECIDELGKTILFSDFKQSTVIAEKMNPKIEMHSNFDNPSVVGLSLPISVGIGIINLDAIVAMTVGNDENVQK